MTPQPAARPDPTGFWAIWLSLLEQYAARLAAEQQQPNQGPQTAMAAPETKTA